MSYSINISEIIADSDKFENETWNAICDDDEKLVSLADDFVDWDDEELSESDIEEKAIWVRESDMLYQIQDSYYPMYNIAHVTQFGADVGELLDIAENAPNISILKIEELDCIVIALNGCGTDFSDSIAYAYLVIDGQIPRSFGAVEKNYTITDAAMEKINEYNEREGLK